LQKAQLLSLTTPFWGKKKTFPFNH